MNDTSVWSAVAEIGSAGSMRQVGNENRRRTAVVAALALDLDHQLSEWQLFCSTDDGGRLARDCWHPRERIVLVIWKPARSAPIATREILCRLKLT
jgi:hypothetical protein